MKKRIFLASLLLAVIGTGVVFAWGPPVPHPLPPPPGITIHVGSGVTPIVVQNSSDEYRTLTLEVTFADGQTENIILTVPARQARSRSTIRGERDRSPNAAIRNVWIISWS